MLRRYLLPGSFALFLLLMFVFFIVGDLGILASYEKVRRIEALEDQLAVLEQQLENRQVAIERLQRDPATIRHYALLYGMQGGEALKETAPLPGGLPKPLPTRSFDVGHFLLSNPGLIVFSLALCLFFFVLMLRSWLRKDAQAETRPPAADKRPRFIRPTWS